MIANEIPRKLVPKSKKKPAPPLPISDWLNELEAKRAKEFHQQTGLDYQNLMKQFIEAADLHPGMQVLEVAAGSGLIVRHLVGMIGREGKLIGLDRTTALVDQARLDAQSAKVGTRIEWKVSPGKHLPYPDGHFDLIICGLAFNQLEATEFFQEAWRALKLNGALLFATELTPPPLKSDLLQKARQQYLRLLKREPEETNQQYYSSHELAEMIQTTGFRQLVQRGLSAQSHSPRNYVLIRAVK